MSEWKEVRLGEICQIFGRIGFRGYTINDFVESKDQGAISLSPTNIIDGEINIDKCSYISWNKYYESPEIMICKNDILIVKTGSSFGRTAIVKEVKHQMTINPQFVVLKNININPIYLSYYIKSKSFQNQISSIIVGSAIPTLSQKNLANLVLKIQDSQTQYNIAVILSSLDAKIETNNKLNEKLEEMAQSIFKSWFVDFEPFKNQSFHETELGMIPEGWKVVSLCDIANFTNGLAMQKYRPNDDEAYLPVLKIKELRQGFCDDTSEICTNDISEDYIAEDGDVIFSWSGTLLVDIWCGGECGVNQHLFKVTSEDYNKWFYYYWIKKHLEEFIRIAKDKAVTMGHIKREHLRNALVVVPDKKTMHNADKIFSPIINRIIESRIESKRLASLRDTILPRLMSGEIKI